LPLLLNLTLKLLFLTLNQLLLLLMALLLGVLPLNLDPQVGQPALLTLKSTEELLATLVNPSPTLVL
jgi:hypothetical protein